MDYKYIINQSNRIFFLFLFILLPSVVAAQSETEKKITIEEKSISLKDVFAKIEQQTGYSVAYEESKIDTKKKISVSLKDASLNKTFTEILKNTGYTYKINGYHIILIPVKEDKKQNTNKKETVTTQTISGKILGKETGLPIEYATVQIINHPSRGAISDSLGYFMIDNIPSGVCDIRVSVMGYEPAVFKDIKEKSGADIVLEISLSKLSHHLNEVIITGSGKAENLVQSSQMGMLSLTQNEIKNIPVIFGEADVIKAIQTQPGVVAGIEGLAGMYVRGGNGDENLYMMDGNPLYQINHMAGLFSPFNTEIIKNVDFYKSAFPARYGGRLSSVVDVHTKDGNLQEYHGTGTLGLTSGSLNVEGPIVKGKTSFNASIRRSWLELISVPVFEILKNRDKKEGKETMARYAFTDLNLKVKHHFNERSQAYVNFYLGNDFLKFSKKEFSLADDYPYQNKDKYRLQWGNILVTSGWNYKINNKLTSDLSISYTNYKSSLKRTISEFSGEENTQDYSNTLIENLTENGINDYSFKADFTYRPRVSHKIHFGAHYTYHRFRPEYVRAITNLDSIKSGKVTADETLPAHEVNLYVEDDWKISSALSLNAGLRFNYFTIQDESFLALEPRISTRLLLTPKMSIKASYSRMNQYVQQVSESYISLPTDFWMPVSKKQQPLVSDQLSAGVYYNLNNEYSFSVEGYHKWMDNLLDYKDGYNFLPSNISWENKLTSGKGWSYGVDIIASKESGRVTGYIGYGLMWADRQFAEINNGVKYPSKYDNRHKINVVANWKISDKVELNGSWTYMTGNRVTIALENYQTVEDAGFPPELAPIGSYYKYYYPGIGYYDKKNNVRLPAYHRLDVGINIYRPQKNGHMGIWNVSVYNAYCHMNPIVITKDSMYTSSGISGESIRWHNNFKTLSIFPIIPSVSYTYKF